MRNEPLTLREFHEDLLRAYQFYYYVLNKPLISDTDFDHLEASLDCNKAVGSDDPKDYTPAQFQLVKYLLERHAK